MPCTRQGVHHFPLAMGTELCHLAVGFCESISGAVCIGDGFRSGRSSGSSGSNGSSGATGVVCAIICKQSSM